MRELRNLRGTNTSRTSLVHNQGHGAELNQCGRFADLAAYFRSKPQAQGTYRNAALLVAAQKFQQLLEAAPRLRARRNKRRLVALVIGLAVLDIGCFVALTATTEIRRAHSSSHEVQPSLSQAWPVWLPFPPPTSVTAQKMDPL